MSDKIFVKQRIRNFARDRFDEVFVAVCTPTQLEDFEEDAPGEGSSYFRTNTIELIARTPEELQVVFDSLVYETKKLVVDLTDLDNLSETQIFNISAIDAVEEVAPAPVILSVLRDSIQNLIIVNFSAEETEFSIPPIYYQYSLDGGLSWKDALPRSTTSPILIQDPRPFLTQNLKIRSVLGKGKYGIPSEGIFVLSVSPPTAPEITNVTPGDQELSISFTAPENTIITNYEYSLNDGAVWTARNPASNSSPLVITGLTNGTLYNVKIRGINEEGYGISSSKVTATPNAPSGVFWLSCTSGGNITQIENLTLLGANWKQDLTGSAVSWNINKNNSAVTLTNLTGSGTLRLRCCYKNTNQGSHSSDGREYPSILVSGLTGVFSGAAYYTTSDYFRMSFNGTQLFNLTAESPSANSFSYYPANSVYSGGYGPEGSLELNQTGLIDILIETNDLISAAVSFNLFYD
jgi:hypothetical protein